MAQHDYVIANGSGAAVRSDLNNALAAIVSLNSGASQPTDTFAYMLWADTTTGQLKIRNAANNAWITLRELDGTLTIEDGTVSAPGLAFADDLNTGIYSPSADQLAVTTNGVERVEFGTSEVVFNDGGANYDFRVEGDTDTNLFFVDASADRIAIGSSTADGKVQITKSGGSTAPTVVVASGGVGDPSTFDPSIHFAAAGYESVGTTKIMSTGSLGARALSFHTGPDGAGTERMKITSTGQAQVASLGVFPSSINNRTTEFTADAGYGGAGQGGLVIYNTSGGVVLGVSATSWASYSDERMKTNLQPITEGLNKVSTLRAVTGRYLTDEENVSRPFLIAQDVEQVLPEAVETGNPDALSLRYTEVIPLLVAALKESKERIEALEAEVASLKQ